MPAMVVISFYRGNLHKVPDTPRRWPIPKPSISLRNFKILLDKRSEALKRLYVQDSTEQDEAEGMGDNDCAKEDDRCLSDPKITEENKRKREQECLDYDKEIKCPKTTEVHQPDALAQMDCDDPVAPKNARDPKRASDCSEPQASESPKARKSDAEEMDVNSDKQDSGSVPEEKLPEATKPTQEVHKSSQLITDKLKRKMELEVKLKELTEEKHHLVQMLKHILSNEEEMKKRGQMAAQSSAMHVSVPFQGETTADGSHTRQAGRNCYGDLEEGELEDACTPSPHSRNLHHVLGAAGSVGSVLGRPPNSSQQQIQSSQQTKVGLTGVGHSPHNPNPSQGLLASPSLLGAYGAHTQHAHLPPLSISGTQVAASSPSPAASSGTSILRDTRRTSPSWNHR